MRFLGNKTSILEEIENLLNEKGLLDKRMIFFDGFTGTGSVADYFKKYYDIVINDNLHWAVTYAYGRLCSSSCKFSELGFDPFVFLNNSTEVKHGFIYSNYSPGGSNRMYFTPENAGRIDYFRFQIETWHNRKIISDDEYSYLLACLIESVSLISNTAGVYGAFLKKWDKRSLKPIVFVRVDAQKCDCRYRKAFCNKIEDIISEVKCDILYLDPPYTQNQYGTQYHLLETIILNDRPSLSKVTGSRPTNTMRSDWSKDIKSHILFDKVIAETQAKYIIMSYNNDGFMSKEYIEATLKRYGKDGTYVCKKIPYKKYENWKSANHSAHFEYLFFVEKKPNKDVVFESPLNYIGNKAKIVAQIKNYINNRKTTFFDLFGGGFNVGINVDNKFVYYVDVNNFVTDLIKSFKEVDIYDYITKVRRYICDFKLVKGDAKSYNEIRSFYNSIPAEKRDPILLFTIILYGYQQQIRFNGNHEFNNPVGMRWFNDKILEKMISFSRKIKACNCTMLCCNYLDVDKEISADSFVYMDPPYNLTRGAYNDGKRGYNGWSETQENELFLFADRLTERNIPFMLSYVVEHKGVKNKALIEWIKHNNYATTELGDVIGISGSYRKEVLITNYAIL